MFNSNVINKILVYLHLRKKYEGEVIPMSEIRPFWNFQLFNIDDHNRRSRLIDFYYVLYRFFKYNPWGNPFQAYREIKWFIQRGYKGYADCDVWSLHSYLDRWLPRALRELKEHKQGVPSTMFEDGDYITEGFLQGNPSEDGMKRGEARWDAIMDKIIAAFEAHNRAEEGLYEDELGPYPMNRPSGISAEAWEKVKDDRFEASKALTERDQKIFEEGAALFIKHYGSLWD